MKYIRNKDTGVIFRYTDLLAKQIENGYLPNLEIIEIDEKKVDSPRSLKSVNKQDKKEK